jgi:hypothetical protein
MKYRVLILNIAKKYETEREGGKREGRSWDDGEKGEVGKRKRDETRK